MLSLHCNFRRFGVITLLYSATCTEVPGTGEGTPAPELYRGHGSAVSLPPLIVGTRHCRVLISGYINSDATGFDITTGRNR